MSYASPAWAPGQPRRAAVLGIAYFGAASVMLLNVRLGHGVAVVWIANALLLAELSLAPRRRWRAPLVACTVANFAAGALFGFGPHYALWISLSCSCESVAAAWTMRRLNRRRGPLESIGGVAIFVLSAGVVAPMLSAFGGAGVAAVAGEPFWANWLAWYVGHALGAITFTPLLVLLLRGDFAQWRERRIGDTMEAAGAILLVTLSCILTFAQNALPLLFLPTLPIVVATFRVGRPGAAISVIIVALIGGWATIANVGPVSLMHGSMLEHLQFFQFYLATTVLTALPIAAELNYRARIHHELRESEARYRLVTDNATDIVINLAPDGTILYVSPSIAKLGGHTPAAVLGTSAMLLIDAEDQAAVEAAHRASLADPDTARAVEYRGILADGTRRWFETNMRGLTGADGGVTGTVGVIRDISRRKSLEQQLSRDADTDYLTGLCNRRHFVRALDGVLEDADTRGGALAIFDIDHFKAINDTHGHAAGDEVLKGFARIARRAVREGDVVARMGGEEFGVLLRGASLAQAAQVCNRLRETIARTPIAAAGVGIVRITVSAGLTVLTGDDGDALLGRADAALYRAKNAGRNRLETAA